MELNFQLWDSKPEEFSQREKLLFLHGMGGTGALWRPVGASLEEEFSVLAPDQRGHGKSQVPHIPASRQTASYTPLDYGRDLVELVEKLNFHPCFVIGHSMGVRSACALAHLAPSFVRGLILVDLGFSGPAGGGLGDGLSTFLKTLPMLFNSREEARNFMAENCPDPAIAQYLMAVSILTSDGKTTFPFDKAALIATIEAARDVSVRAWVREFGERGLPVLMLRGEKSLVWSREEFQTERETFAKFPSIEFREVAGAGHGLPFEKRKEFLDLIRSFVKVNESEIPFPARP